MPPPLLGTPPPHLLPMVGLHGRVARLSDQGQQVAERLHHLLGISHHQVLPVLLGELVYAPEELVSLSLDLLRIELSGGAVGGEIGPEQLVSGGAVGDGEGRRLSQAYGTKERLGPASPSALPPLSPGQPVPSGLLPLRLHTPRLLAALKLVPQVKQAAKVIPRLLRCEQV